MKVIDTISTFFMGMIVGWISFYLLIGPAARACVKLFG